MPMIYWYYKKWIYLSINNPFKNMNKVKGVFIPLKRYFKFSKEDWFPVLWVSNPSKIQIIFHDVMWKDKYDTPRYECCPYIWIHLFGYNFIWYWTLPEHLKYIEEYWEQALWYLYYYNTYSQGLLDKPNIEKAKENWPWQDGNGNSSWNDNYLVK